MTVGAGMSTERGADRRAVLVGGSGFVGSATARVLNDLGVDVTVVDRAEPPAEVLQLGVRWRRCDLLVDDVVLPEGEVVLLVGNGDPRTRWAWHQPMQTVVSTGRLLSALDGRHVTLCSTLEVYGTAPAPLTEDSEPHLPWDDEKLRYWIDRAVPMFGDPCPPWRVAAWCRELLDADPTGRWVYGMAKRAQEILVSDTVPATQLTILRLANTVGPGQERVVSRFARRAAGGRTLEVSHPVRRSFLPVDHVGRVVHGEPGPGVFIVGSPSIELMQLAERVVESVGGNAATVEARPVTDTDSCGDVRATALQRKGLGVDDVGTWIDDAVASILDVRSVRIHPPIGVVVPPRAAAPDLVTEKQQAALWSGAVKHGNRWSVELQDRLVERLGIGADRQLLATTSGTDALRIMCGAIVGPAEPGQVAVVPSFTFPATAEIVAQLGYRVRFVDVDDSHWTMDPGSLRQALAPGDVSMVVAVDTFGHPADYPALQAVCDDAGVVLLADSAAALGSSLDGRPVGQQALGHSYSMSFAKVLSAGGAGGAVVLPADVDPHGPYGWTRSALMNELHAIVALDQLDHLTEMVTRRQRLAELYSEAATRLGIGHQIVRDGVGHSWVHFVMRIPGGARERDRVAARLARSGVGTKPYFLPLHSSGAELDSVRADGPDLPVTERLGDESLAVPMSSELNDEAVDRICVAFEHALQPGD